MSEDQDESQKTEEATPKRLQDAYNKGQVPFSREVTSFLMFVILTLMIMWLAPGMMMQTVNASLEYIARPHEFRLNQGSAIAIASNVIKDYFLIMLVPIIGLVFVILMSSFLQNGIVISANSIMPKLDRISPLAGFKRLFSMRSMVEFIKGIFKISLIGAVAFFAVYPEVNHLKDIFTYSLMDMIIYIGMLCTRVMIGVTVAMGIIAGIDLSYQRFEFFKSLRMSKQDIKDEMKQMEGNPEVKAKLRELRKQRAQNRQMMEVPTADAVVTNPTHYSVALRYDPKVADAPIVVAKGQDLIALKIREIAKEHKVPIVQNPPLARALFSSVEIEEEVPVEHYNAVAEVIRYVYKLKGKKL